MQTHGKIAEYWSNKAITDSGNLIDAEYGRAIPKGALQIIDDLGEPCCMACGKPVGDDCEEADNLSTRWNQRKVISSLNKCHILAVQFGGGDETENIFLMCERCHKASPDTRNRDAFFRWVYQRKRNFSFGIDFKDGVTAVVEELKNRGYTDYAFSLMQNIDNQDIVSRLSSNIGIHSASASPSSIVIGFADSYEQALADKIKVIKCPT